MEKLVQTGAISATGGGSMKRSKSKGKQSGSRSGTAGSLGEEG